MDNKHIIKTSILHWLISENSQKLKKKKIRWNKGGQKWWLSAEGQWLWWYRLSHQWFGHRYPVTGWGRNFSFREWEMDYFLQQWGHSHPWSQLPPMVSLGAHSGRKEYLPSSSHQTAAPSLRWAPGRLSTWEHGTPAPGSWGASQRIDFRKPGLLHLPIHRKALNSLI